MREQQDIATDAQALKARLLKAGLFKSHQLMDAVTTELGWEIARKREKDQPHD